MKDFIANNLQYFVFFGIIALALILAISIYLIISFYLMKKSLTVKKFKIFDLNEQDEIDYTPYCTAVVANTSVNSVTIDSIGFVHGGNYFNFTDTLRNQLKCSQAPTIAPRSTIKLKLKIDVLEKVIFPSLSVKKLGKIKIYVITSSGEKFQADCKIITELLYDDYRTYFDLHSLEINQKFIEIVKEKAQKNVKISFGDKMRYNSLRKEIPSLPSLDELTSKKEEAQGDKTQKKQENKDNENSQTQSQTQQTDFSGDNDAVLPEKDIEVESSEAQNDD